MITVSITFHRQGAPQATSQENTEIKESYAALAAQLSVACKDVEVDVLLRRQQRRPSGKGPNQLPRERLSSPRELVRLRHVFVESEKPVGLE